MLRLKQTFRESYLLFKSLKVLVATALLIAIGILLDQFSIKLNPTTKIGVSFIANQLTAMMFGPVVGAVMGGVSDILKFMIRPDGSFLIGYTINAMLGPLIYGVILFKKPISLWRIFFSKAVVAVFVNLLLGSYWNSAYFGAAYLALLPGKLLQQVIQVPLQSLLFYVVAVALKKAKVFQMFS